MRCSGPFPFSAGGFVGDVFREIPCSVIFGEWYPGRSWTSTVYWTLLHPLVVSVFEATVYGSQTTGSTETQTVQNLGQTLGFGKQPHQIDLLQICDEITRLSWGHDFVTQKHRKPRFLPANIEINIAIEVGVQPWVTALRGPRPCLRVSIREFSCPTLAARNDGDKRYMMQSNISLNNRWCSQVWTMVINYSSSYEMVWVLYITIPPIRCWVHTSLSLLNSSYYTLWATWLKATAVVQETSMGSIGIQHLDCSDRNCSGKFMGKHPRLFLSFCAEFLTQTALQVSRRLRLSPRTRSATDRGYARQVICTPGGCAVKRSVITTWAERISKKPWVKTPPSRMELETCARNPWQFLKSQIERFKTFPKSFRHFWIAFMLRANPKDSAVTGLWLNIGNTFEKPKDFSLFIFIRLNMGCLVIVPFNSACLPYSLNLSQGISKILKWLWSPWLHDHSAEVLDQIFAIS